MINGEKEEKRAYLAPGMPPDYNFYHHEDLNIKLKKQRSSFSKSCFNSIHADGNEVIL
jgi:hypothetical protein